MKVAILSRNRQLFTVRRLLAEAKKLGMTCAVIDPLECQILVGKGESQILFHDKPLPAFDIVIPRIGTSITDFGLALVRQFELLGVSVLNGSKGIADSRDKLRCLQELAQRGFDVPKSVLIRSSRHAKNALRHIAGTPAVIKLLQGTQGVGVMLVESQTSAESVLDTLDTLDQDVVLQQYIAESAGRDIRAFVVGGKVIAAMRRESKSGDFRSNIHRGGEGTILKLSREYERVAVNSAKALGLVVAGVDILESLNGPKIIEVNSSPGFEGLEQATGANIARMILKEAQIVARAGKRKRGPKSKAR